MRNNHIVFYLCLKQLLVNTLGLAETVACENKRFGFQGEPLIDGTLYVTKIEVCSG